MRDKEVFIKYIKGLRCTREEYLIVQEFLKIASDEVKELYDRFMELICNSLISNKARSEAHFRAAVYKHGLTEDEALLLIQDFKLKQDNENGFTKK